MVMIVLTDGPHLVTSGNAEDETGWSSFLYKGFVSRDIPGTSTDFTYRIAAISSTVGSSA